MPTCGVAFMACGLVGCGNAPSTIGWPLDLVPEEAHLLVASVSGSATVAQSGNAADAAVVNAIVVQSWLETQGSRQG